MGQFRIILDGRPILFAQAVLITGLALDFVAEQQPNMGLDVLTSQLKHSVFELRLNDKRQIIGPLYMLPCKFKWPIELCSEDRLTTKLDLRPPAPVHVAARIVFGDGTPIPALPVDPAADAAFAAFSRGLVKTKR
ncbi:MAG: hypothetical protein ACYC6M_02950 [Terriglobales bacterium]